MPRPRRAAFSRSQRGGLPAIVEAHAVDHRPVLGQPEQPRLRIARLRPRGERADLDEAEAEARASRPAPRHPCRSRRPARPATGKSSPATARRSDPARTAAGVRVRRELQRRDRRPMRRLGVEREGERAKQRIELTQQPSVMPTRLDRAFALDVMPLQLSATNGLSFRRAIALNRTGKLRIRRCA